MRDASQFQSLPQLVGGILIGGASRRMGCAKALLDWQGETFVERIASALATVVPEVVLLGSGIALPPKVAHLQVLADSGQESGPLAGLLTAFRYRPGAAWLIATCDQPLLSTATLAWLIGERRSDRIAVLPRLVPGRIEPFPGLYEPACAAALAKLAGPDSRSSLQPLAAVPGVHLLDVPAGLVVELTGVNRRDELEALRREAALVAKDPDCDR
ncbi:MAG: molybdenum cofactor guanylyltransferase [Thermoanaerobaculia bacterium]